MGSDSMKKRQGQTFHLVQTLAVIVVLTVTIIVGVDFLKTIQGSMEGGVRGSGGVVRAGGGGGGTVQNGGGGSAAAPEHVAVPADNVQQTTRRSRLPPGEQGLPIDWSQLRGVTFLFESDDPTILLKKNIINNPNRKRKKTDFDTSRREFRFTLTGGNWEGIAKTTTREKPFKTRIPFSEAEKFRQTLEKAVMFEAMYAHSHDHKEQLSKMSTRKVYRPYVDSSDSWIYHIRFEFDNLEDDIELVSMSHSHCDLKRKVPECGHFPWVIKFFDTELNEKAEPELQWIVDSKVIDDALDLVVNYMRG